MTHVYSRIFSRTIDLPGSSSSSSSSTSESEKTIKSKIWPWCSLVFGVLWIVPVVSVLVLSFRDHIVGQSIGCLNQSNKKCRLDLHAFTQVQQAQTLAKADEEVKAGLQIAAKALETWFCFICASLIWIVLKRLAGEDDTDALPIGYLHVHTECQDLRILPKLAWGRRLDASRLKGWAQARLYLFIAFVTSICILCNLMGSATAILVLPNIQWTAINKGTDTWLENVFSASRPLSSSIARNCNESQVLAGSYSCTYKSYGLTTDMVVAAAVATNDQTFKLVDDQPNGNQVIDVPLSPLVLPPIMQEASVSFTVNISDSSFMWTPSRQTLRDISTDLTDYDYMTGNNPLNTQEYPQSNLFSRSLQTRFQRRGPVLGQDNRCYKNLPEKNVGIFPAGGDREVCCYDLWDEGLWKCIPWGRSWKDIQQAGTTFTIGDGYADSTSNSTIAVTIFSTSSSLEMENSTYGMIQRKEKTFDWATAFDTGNSPETKLTGPQQIFEYKRIEPMKDSNPQPGQSPNRTAFVWCDSKTVLGLADYVLNPSRVSNPMRLTEMNAITETPQPIFMHPEWSLAAWSVDRTGPYNTAGKKRGASRNIIIALENWIKLGDLSQAAMDFRYIHKFVAVQTLSMVSYSTTSIKPKDGTHSLLSRKAMIQVWKYDHQSSSSRFAIAILILGLVCVVARTYLYLFDREEMKDATEILVQALKTVNRQNRSSSSRTPSLLTANSGTEDYNDDGSEDEKEFPVVQVKPVPPPNFTDTRTKRIPYRSRVQETTQADEQALACTQTAAKTVLEAWFGFSSANSVYSLFERLASQKYRLPVGFIHMVLHTLRAELRVIPKLV
ncbi:hypothetical protein FKW77_004324 [Venturia effusa]|uniref:Uncharacterized protein n=1 Tax=Venturia effusa TaxID=50376 RepID=A0A517LNS5_9PEZI|nr:hypothetical protein FKW77_004324 [Venturia effusa]